MHRTNLDRRLPITLLLALAPLVAVACNWSPDLGFESINPPPGTPIRFASDIQPIFTFNCASASCHGSPFQADLNLEPGNAYGNLVDVVSSQTAFKRVDPGMSDLSYLIMKLEQDNPPVGERMPRGGPFLDPMEVRVIRDWIDQGAPNN